LAQSDLDILRMMQEQYSQEFPDEQNAPDDGEKSDHSDEDEDDDTSFIRDDNDDNDASDDAQEQETEEYRPDEEDSTCRSDTREKESKISTQASEDSFVEPHGKHLDPDNFSDEKLGSMYGLHVEDVGQMRKAFSGFDQDGSGNISVLELNKVFESCGVRLNMTELEAIVKQVDKDGGGEIGFSEFVALMVQQGAIKSDPLIKARSAFDHFDVDQSSFIDMNELKNAILFYMPNVSEVHVMKIMRAADLDGNGQVSFEEFCGLIGAGEEDLAQDKKQTEDLPLDEKYNLFSAWLKGNIEKFRRRTSLHDQYTSSTSKFPLNLNKLSEQERERIINNDMLYSDAMRGYFDFSHIVVPFDAHLARAGLTSARDMDLFTKKIFELQISCKCLPRRANRDVDPRCILVRKGVTKTGEAWTEHYPTERLQNNTAPRFAKKIRFEISTLFLNPKAKTSYYQEKLTFYVYDDPDPFGREAPFGEENVIGFLEVTIGQIIAGCEGPNSIFERSLDKYRSASSGYADPLANGVITINMVERDAEQDQVVDEEQEEKEVSPKYVPRVARWVQHFRNNTMMLWYQFKDKSVRNSIFIRTDFSSLSDGLLDLNEFLGLLVCAGVMNPLKEGVLETEECPLGKVSKGEATDVFHDVDQGKGLDQALLKVCVDKLVDIMTGRLKKKHGVLQSGKRKNLFELIPKEHKPRVRKRNTIHERSKKNWDVLHTQMERVKNKAPEEVHLCERTSRNKEVHFACGQLFDMAATSNIPEIREQTAPGIAALALTDGHLLSHYGAVGIVMDLCKNSDSLRIQSECLDAIAQLVHSSAESCKQLVEAEGIPWLLAQYKSSSNSVRTSSLQVLSNVLTLHGNEVVVDRLSNSILFGLCNYIVSVSEEASELASKLVFQLTAAGCKEGMVWEPLRTLKIETTTSLTEKSFVLEDAKQKNSIKWMVEMIQSSDTSQLERLSLSKVRSLLRRQSTAASSFHESSFTSSSPLSSPGRRSSVFSRSSRALSFLPLDGEEDGNVVLRPHVEKVQNFLLNTFWVLMSNTRGHHALQVAIDILLLMDIGGVLAEELTQRNDRMIYEKDVLYLGCLAILCRHAALRVKQSIDEHVIDDVVDKMLRKKAVKPFAWMEKKELRVLAERSHYKRVRKGTLVLRQGQMTKSLYIILSGEIEVKCKTGGKTKAVSVSKMSSGHMWGESALFMEEACFGSLEVISTSCELLEVTQEALRSMLSENEKLKKRAEAYSEELMEEVKMKNRRRDRDIPTFITGKAAYMSESGQNLELPLEHRKEVLRVAYRKLIHRVTFTLPYLERFFLASCSKSAFLSITKSHVGVKASAPPMTLDAWNEGQCINVSSQGEISPVQLVCGMVLDCLSLHQYSTCFDSGVVPHIIGLMSVHQNFTSELATETIWRLCKSSRIFMELSREKRARVIHLLFRKLDQPQKSSYEELFSIVKSLAQDPSYREDMIALRLLTNIRARFSKESPLTPSLLSSYMSLLLSLSQYAEIFANFSNDANLKPFMLCLERECGKFKGASSDGSVDYAQLEKMLTLLQKQYSHVLLSSRQSVLQMRETLYLILQERNALDLVRSWSMYRMPEVLRPTPGSSRANSSKDLMSSVKPAVVEEQTSIQSAMQQKRPLASKDAKSALLPGDAARDLKEFLSTVGVLRDSQTAVQVIGRGRPEPGATARAGAGADSGAAAGAGAGTAKDGGVEGGAEKSLKLVKINLEEHNETSPPSAPPPDALPSTPSAAPPINEVPKGKRLSRFKAAGFTLRQVNTLQSDARNQREVDSVTGKQNLALNFKAAYDAKKAVMSDFFLNARSDADADWDENTKWLLGVKTRASVIALENWQKKCDQAVSKQFVEDISTVFKHLIVDDSFVAVSNEPMPTMSKKISVWRNHDDPTTVNAAITLQRVLRRKLIMSFVSERIKKGASNRDLVAREGRQSSRNRLLRMQQQRSTRSLIDGSSLSLNLDKIHETDAPPPPLERRRPSTAPRVSERSDLPDRPARPKTARLASRPASARIVRESVARPGSSQQSAAGGGEEGATSLQRENRKNLWRNPEWNGVHYSPASSRGRVLEPSHGRHKAYPPLLTEKEVRILKHAISAPEESWLVGTSRQPGRKPAHSPAENSGASTVVGDNEDADVLNISKMASPAPAGTIAAASHAVCLDPSCKACKVRWGALEECLEIVEEQA